MSKDIIAILFIDHRDSRFLREEIEWEGEVVGSILRKVLDIGLSSCILAINIAIDDLAWTIVLPRTGKPVTFDRIVRA